MTKAIGVVVMQVAGDDRDRQCRQAGNHPAHVVIAGGAAVDQECWAFLDQQISIIIKIAGWLADRSSACAVWFGVFTT
jgi:hypothetical protein